MRALAALAAIAASGSVISGIPVSRRPARDGQRDLDDIVASAIDTSAALQHRR